MIIMSPKIVSLPGELTQVVALKAAWDKVPYSATTSALAEVAKDILEQCNHPGLYKPSVRAGLSDVARRNHTVQLIDYEYTIALREQIRALIDASMADLATSNKDRETRSDFYDAVASGIARLFAKYPAIPILRFHQSMILATVGVISGVLHHDTFIREKIKIEISVNRNKWFVRFQELEKIWHNRALTHIQNRVSVITREVNDIGPHLVDVNLNNELSLLSDLKSSISANANVNQNPLPTVPKDGFKVTKNHLLCGAVASCTLLFFKFFILVGLILGPILITETVIWKRRPK